MIIAAVINSKNQITPIVEGEVLRLFDLKTKQFTDYTNPASKLKEGRRGATLKFAEDHGATAFVSPPETFCELSYAKAKEDGIQFIQINANISFDEFQSLLQKEQLRLYDELPDQDIVPSGVPKV